jgi:hypothetical protein
MRSGCTWGDEFAYRWSLTSAKSGAYGLILSDFSDSQPGAESNVHDFNPRIVSAFLDTTGADGSAPASPRQADWIVGHAYDQWNDFIADGYARFYAALAKRVGAATGKDALVVDQCGMTASTRRLYGIDARIIARTIAPSNYVCIWDDHVIQADRAGPLSEPPTQELAGFIVGAAREPLLRNGANLEADDAAYWSAIAKFYPGLDPSARREVGYKLLKRLWLWSAWAHLADRNGEVRRALAFVSRDYWDGGSLAALDPLTNLIRAIVPTRPFGPALYYSTALERKLEQASGAEVGTREQDLPTYLPAKVLQEFIDAGGPVGYYVSDAALPALRRTAPKNAPSAWIVLGGASALPATELSALSAIAPVVDSTESLARLPRQPLALSERLSGFAFYDQAARLILIVTNPSTAPDAQASSGEVRMSGLALSDGPHAVKDLFSGSVSSIRVADHDAVLPIDLPRWDTRAYAISSS